MMTKIYDDGVLEADLYDDGWVFVRWIQNMRGRLQKSLVRQMLKMEQIILGMRARGWFTRSEADHADFHKLLEKFGAKRGDRDEDGYIVFYKPITKEGDFHVRLRS